MHFSPFHGMSACYVSNVVLDDGDQVPACMETVICGRSQTAKAKHDEYDQMGGTAFWAHKARS